MGTISALKSPEHEKSSAHMLLKKQGTFSLFSGRNNFSKLWSNCRVNLLRLSFASAVDLKERVDWILKGMSLRIALRALTLERSQIKRSGFLPWIMLMLQGVVLPETHLLYRTKFEAALPDIMESFNDLYRSITGRITAEGP
ncbi:hypothetical protein OIU79_011305 [Salix purpurea]|uniref:Uncharacterized protein n=1 Tax=Salix purpurea TaxID=77065 RepID=A0A9Q0Q0D7_SALPP|nr:hypothetical protein OIU79_011305 [Salix purpurea]